MVRPDDMNLPAETPFLQDAGAQHVCRVLSEAGHLVLFVGGCVRNALLKEPQSDIDISTDARPDRVMALADAAGLRAIPTGIDHGTVTLMVGDTPYEVTTFRRDVETDGRRAVVAFSDRIEDDALRRDFTMNALYATPEGQIVDPLGGLGDALARRVVFIQDARARMREDYLRILRFFRFWTYYADQDNGFTAETLAAIADCLDGLETLSAERIGSEMLKLLAAPDPSRAVATMEQIGIFTRILPIASTQVLPVLVHLEGQTGTAPSALRRLASLGPDGASDRLRLSRDASRELAALVDSQGSAHTPRALGFLLGETLGWDACLLRAAALEQEMDAADQAAVSAGAKTTFPVQAADLMPKFQGPALGAELQRLRERWLGSDLTLSREALLG